MLTSRNSIEHFHALNLLLFHTPQKSSAGFRSRDWEGQWRTLNLSPVWDEFQLSFIFILEAAIKRCVQEGMSRKICTRSETRLKSGDWLVLGGPECAKKWFPTPLHHRLGPWIHAIGAKFWPYCPCASFIRPDYNFPVFSCPDWMILIPLWPQLSVLSEKTNVTIL